jgi:hypothetical protein
MNAPRRSILSVLDSAIRWTGMPARIADNMSADALDRRHRPLRWLPIWPIAFACAVVVLALIWPHVLEMAPPGALIAMVSGFVGTIIAMVPAIHGSGPLGKSSLEDDEREQVLRKDSFLFCLWILAAVNCVGQPILMILSHWQGWRMEQSASVVLSIMALNAALLGSLPTLYASWSLREA